MAQHNIPAPLAGLPPELQRECVVDFRIGCAMAGLSVRHARRLIADGKFPKPVQLGGHKHGLVVGEVLDTIRRARAAA